MRTYDGTEVAIPFHDFRALRQVGAIAVGLDKRTAAMIYADRLLRPRRAVVLAHAFWRTVALLALVGGLVLAFTWHWWAALAGLALAAALIRADEEGSKANLLREADEDQGFYERVAAAELWRYQMDDQTARPFLLHGLA